MMTLVEKLALETLAVTLFESFLRQQGTENREKSTRDWSNLTTDDRNYWRETARAIIKEQD